MGLFDGKKAPEETRAEPKEDEVTLLRKQIDELTAKNRVLSGQNNAYMFTSREQSEKIEALQTKLAAYEGKEPPASVISEIDGLKAKISSLEEELAKSKKECANLISKQANMKDICTRAVNLGNRYKAELQSTQSELAGLKTELEQLRKTSGGSSKGTSALEAELSGIKVQRDTLIEKASELEQKISDLEAQIEALQETISTKDSETAELKRKSEQEKALYDKLSLEKITVERECKTAKLSLERVQSELETSQGLLERANSDNAKAQDEIARLKKVVEAYKAQLKSVKDLLSGNISDIG